MRDFAPTIAAAVLTFWAALSFAERPKPPLPAIRRPVVQQLSPTPAAPEWRLPDPRTITQFPGP